MTTDAERLRIALVNLIVNARQAVTREVDLAAAVGSGGQRSAASAQRRSRVTTRVADTV